MLCVVFGRADGHAHTGGADGRVYRWEGNSLKKAIAGHSGPIFAMQAVEKVRIDTWTSWCSTDNVIPLCTFPATILSPPLSWCQGLCHRWQGWEGVSVG